MKREKERKSHELCIRVTASEYAQLREGFQSTTHRVFSEYIRTILRRGAVVKKYRNVSLDEIQERLVDIKNRQDSIGRSFDDAVAKLVSLPPGMVTEQIIEFLLAEQFSLVTDINQTKSMMVKIYEKCAQMGSGFRE